VPTLTIDNVAVHFEPGETLLQAATRAGIAIPTLCSLEGIEPPTSCYVCVVKIQGKSGMAPSCATLAEEGMILESSSEEVRRYRRRALELLLSEHAGDCEAPCRRICPADLDIPVMARHIVEGQLDAAARAVRERLALPGILGHICPAPCQKGCVRAHGDGAVSIRELHKGVAEAASTNGASTLPCAAPASGKRVTVIGAGPAGLSSAYYLSLLGHACTIVDEREEPGGMLRYGVDRATLPQAVLDREIAVIRSLGVEFRMGSRVGDQHALDSLIQRSDAVVFATGAPAPELPWPFDIKASPKGIAVEPHTFATGSSGVFACGGAIAVCRMAARAVGQGRLAAQSVHHFLTHSSQEACSERPRHLGSPRPLGAEGVAWSPRFDSHLSKIDAEELRQLAATDLASSGIAASKSVPFDSSLVAAASRCMQCGCGKKLSCALRAYAHEYEAHRDQYRTGARKHVTRTRYASGLVHEPGKCIDCGRCIGITAAEQIQPGLAFGNRGFDVAVKAPFSADIDIAMGSALDRCIAACPVGALLKANGMQGA
jgi:ferredoxin